MRYAIFSDVHSNLEAFQSVLQEIEKLHVDKRLFLGDIVGYGANPNEAIDLLKGTADVTLAGNHDFAAIDMTDVSYFNPHAKEAILWTKDVLTPAHKEFLKGLPVDTVVDSITLAHSSPKEPQMWHYIFNIFDAIENFEYFNTRLCFIGHSHHPVVIERNSEGKTNASKDQIIQLNEASKYIINAGSVGQPRDKNPQACFVIYDSGNMTVEFKRVQYDIASAQEKMRKEGLPDYLIERLAYGK
ncbi:MAG: metallophosphoesterase family protein [Nitrospinae bacterium]|nr:metallophosphoesterase family protein [Nitrospinota bacterium]MBI3814790.1 metallophosphoesterase family protein [Nitrospinota bacterium]